jgi:uncharacterized protein YecT (DUF1311 family)
MHRFLAVIAINFAITFPTHAQTPEDTTTLEACLKTVEARREEAANTTPPETKPGPEAHLDEAAARSRLAPESCIGIISTPCLQTDEGMSTYGMMACFGRELDVWDARLNTAYKAALASDADSGFDDKSAEVIAQNLRDVQRNWIPFRDATCDVLHSDGIPIFGSQSKVDGVDCHLQLTARQALWIEGKLTYGGEN